MDLLTRKTDSTLHETDSKLASENFNGFEDEVKPFRSRILFSGANLLLVSGSVHSLDIFVEIQVQSQHLRYDGMTFIKRSASSLVDKVKPSTISISPRVFVEGSRMPAAVLGEAMGTWSCVLIISLISEPEKYTVITWQFCENVTFLGWWWLSVTLWTMVKYKWPTQRLGMNKKVTAGSSPGVHVFCTELGGGNSNIFYVHPEPWGNNPPFD